MGWTANHAAACPRIALQCLNNCAGEFPVQAQRIRSFRSRRAENIPAVASCCVETISWHGHPAHVLLPMEK